MSREKKKALYVSITQAAYNHLENSANRGGYRSAASLVAQLLECLTMKAMIAREHHPLEVAEEIEEMFNLYSEWESDIHG